MNSILCPVCRQQIAWQDYFEHRERETERRIMSFIKLSHPDWIQPDGTCPRGEELYHSRRRPFAR